MIFVPNEELYKGESFQDYSWIQDFEAGWLSVESQPQNTEFSILL